MICQVNAYHYEKSNKVVVPLGRVEEKGTDIILEAQYPECFKLIKKYIDNKGFKSYYYNCYVTPEGVYNVDYGSYSDFCEFYKVNDDA